MAVSEVSLSRSTLSKKRSNLGSAGHRLIQSFMIPSPVDKHAELKTLLNPIC